MNRILGVIATGISLFLFVGVESVMAQEDELNRHVEVNKEYVPDVGKAVKLGIIPRMTDTVSLRPEIDYSIRPAVWHTGFGVPAIQPVRLDMTAYRFTEPFFLKAGMGYPLQSLVDFYGHWDSRQGGGGVYVNHYGQYADIKNDAGRKEPATETANSVGAYGMHAWGRTAIRGEIGYDYRLVSRYGTVLQLRPNDESGVQPYFPDVARQHYSTPRARVELGNDFKDLSRFNFRIGLEGYYLSDRYDNEETGLRAIAEIGKKFGVHTFRLKGGFDGYWGNDQLDYVDRMAMAGLGYGIDMERFKLTLGVDYVYDDGPQDHWFFPDFRMTFDVTSGYFVPFVEVNGQLQNNGYRNTSLQNPFVAAGLVMPNTAEYNGRAGISGSFSSSFSYKAYAGVTFFRNLNFFAYQPVDATFGYLTDHASCFSVGAELDGRVSGSFSLEAAAHYYGYTVKSLPKAGDRPDFDVSLNLRYDYRDKFTIRAGADLLGRRYCYEIPYLKERVAVGDYEMVRLDPVVDVNLEVQLRVGRRTKIFLAGHNLACSKLYLFDHYPSLGINATGGVILSF